MGNGMKKYEDFIEGLQKDMEIPQTVQEKFYDTLESLPTPSGHGTDKHRPIRRWVSAAAIAAAVLVGGTGFCLANPVLAAKIPLIGKIFEQVEKDVSFSGDFKDKAQVLAEEPANEEQSDNAAEAQERQQDIKSTQLGTAYTASDQGVTITASEVYCDGHSVFLTAEIHVDAGGLSSIPSYYTSGTTDGESTTAQFLYTKGGWVLEQGGSADELTDDHFQGVAVDDNTFAGMIKVDLDALQETDDVLNLTFSMIGYDDVNESDSEDIGISNKYEGNWNLSIPFSVDTEDVHMIEVNKTMENGCGIEKIFVSPYQVVVYEIDPAIPLTEEEIKEAYEGLNRKREEVGEPSIPLEEFRYEDYYSEIREGFDLVAFTQDGVKLDYGEGDQQKRFFAIQGHEVSQLQFFLAKEHLSILMLDNIDEVKELADFEIVVDVK